MDELDHEKPERKDEQGAFGDQIPSPPRPAPVMAPSKVAESLGHLNTLRGTSGQEDTAAGQGQLSSLRATCGQVSQGLSFDGLALEDFKLPPEARDALATVAPQLHSTELASPEHLAAQLEAVAWKVYTNCMWHFASFGLATIYICTTYISSAADSNSSTSKHCTTLIVSGVRKWRGSAVPKRWPS